MITIKDVEHVAKLARLELTEEEKEKFTKQLGDVLKHVDAMNEVDTSNVEPMAHAIDFVNVMRDDKVYYEQTKEELMKNAPDEENGFFRVPKINSGLYIRFNVILNFCWHLTLTLSSRRGEVLVVRRT